MLTHPSHTADQRLLRAAAQAGDERAFRRLIEPYRRALAVHSYRMLGSVHDAEDVVQETLLRAWRHLERFEPRARLQTWLYRIATNACLDELERRPRRPAPIEPFPDGLLDDLAAPTYDPAARYALREGMELALLTAVQLLPGRQRAVLILRDVLGWTAPEVADLLDSTVAAINSALQRARATIDEELPAHALVAPDPAERELLGRYIDVWTHDDVDGLVQLLREDAVLRMPPQRAVHGAVAVAGYLHGVTGGDFTKIAMRPTRANGRPAIAMHERTAEALVPHGVMVLEVRDGRIAGLDAFIGAEMLAPFESRSA